MPNLYDSLVIGKENYLLYPVTGHFTARRAIGLKKDILSVLPSRGQKVVLDMTAVTDADVVGTNALVQIFLAAMKQECMLEIRLFRDQPLDRMLHLCKFHRQFNLVYV